MKKLVIFIILLALACTAPPKQIQKLNAVAGPLVHEWLRKHDPSGSEKLAVTVKSAGTLKDYDFLNQVTENFYTGRASYMDIQLLMRDSLIKKISTGMQKLHK